MTNNEHNEKVLAEISKHLEAIEELKATIKPADALQEVSLEQCNAGAREAHFAKYAEQERMKQAVAAALAGGAVQQELVVVEPEPEPGPEPENDAGDEPAVAEKPAEKPAKAVKNESAKTKAE